MKLRTWDEMWDERVGVPPVHPGTRSIAAEQTLERIRGLLRIAEITRLADVTGLDVIGVPVWQAVRPRSRNLSVAQGKGLTDVEAKVGAIMEAFEMFCAEAPGVDRVAPIAEIAPVLSYDLDILPGLIGNADVEVPRRWRRARFLDDGRKSYLPYELLTLDFTRQDICRPWLLPTSNGLASGNCAVEATIHGLYEVIERHSLAEKNSGREVLIDSLAFCRHPSLQSLFQTCALSGIEVQVLDRTGAIDVPCAQVRLAATDRATIFSGTGCHLQPSIAVLKAFLEAIQSRLTAISGARDDIDESDYGMPAAPSDEDRGALACPQGGGAFSGTAVPCPGHPAAELGELLARLAKFGYRPLVTELIGRPDAYSVCFVVVPGMAGPIG